MPQPKSRKIAVLGYRSVGKSALLVAYCYVVLCIVYISFLYFSACMRFVRARVS